MITFKQMARLAGYCAFMLLVCLPAACGDGFFLFIGDKDPDPPFVVSTFPQNGATGVPVTVELSVTFSETIRASTATGETFLLRESAGARVAGTVSASGRTVFFRPASGLAPLTTYVATLTTGITDPSGERLRSEFTFVFTTGDF